MKVKIELVLELEEQTSITDSQLELLKIEIDKGLNYLSFDDNDEEIVAMHNDHFSKIKITRTK